MACVFLFFSSLVVALSGALMPGPLMTATISESTRRGALAGPLFILGHGLLELVLVAVIAAGFASVLQRREVFIGVSVVGSVVMLWMAAGMFRSLPRLELNFEVRGKAYGHLVAEGILLSLANPYWTLWWVTIGLGYILRGRELGFPGLAAFLGGHLTGDLLWYAALSLAVAKGRRFLKPAPYRLLIGLCASVLSGFGLFFLYSGISKYLEV